MIKLQLPYSEPYDWEQVLAFLRYRVIPGVEEVTADGYRRTAKFGSSVGVISVSKGEHSHLQLEFDAALEPYHVEIVNRVTKQFDLTCDIDDVNRRLTDSPILQSAIENHPGTRVPGAWDGFETVLRAILGQQVTVKASLTIAGRVVERHSEKLPEPRGGLTALSPSADTLHNANLDSLGLTGARIRTIHAVAAAVVSDGLNLDAGDYNSYINALTALPGIGDWTAQYTAMRGLKENNAFPAGDLILRRAATTLGNTLTEKQLRAQSEAWSPYRAYAVIHLWRSYDADAFKAAKQQLEN